MHFWGEMYAHEVEPGMVLTDSDSQGESMLITSVDLDLPVAVDADVAIFGRDDFATYREMDRVKVFVTDDWYQVNVGVTLEESTVTETIIDGDPPGESS